MPEAGFPNSHTTGTQPQGTTQIFMDLGVIKSIFGYVKIAEIVLSLLGFICIMSSPAAYFSRGTWFNTVAMGCFWCSGILLALYVFHLPDKATVIPWKKFEFVFYVIWTFFYLIAASLAASMTHDEALAAAAFFGFSAMVACAVDAWFAFTHIKGVVIVRTTTEQTSPTQY